MSSVVTAARALLLALVLVVVGGGLVGCVVHTQPYPGSPSAVGYYPGHPSPQTAHGPPGAVGCLCACACGTHDHDPHRFGGLYAPADELPPDTWHHDDDDDPADWLE